MRIVRIVFFAAASTLVPCANGSTVTLHGKVVMEDGSAPDKTVSIERVCGGDAQRIAMTNGKGEYLWRMDTTPASLAAVSSMGVGHSGSGSKVDTSADERMNTWNSARSSCVLRASASGYDSSFVDLSRINAFSNPVLPPLTIVRHGSNPSFDVFTSATPPRAASRAWNRAAEYIQNADWPGAERELRKSVEAAPHFAQGWNGLGVALQNQHKLSEAREAYQHAVDADPKLLAPYLLIARITVAEKDWEATARTADALIKIDAKHRYLEIYLHQAVARFQLKDLDGAAESAQELIRLDTKHEVARGEYVLGLILEAKGDFQAAAERMQRYLDLEPKSADANAVRLRLRDLGKQEPGDVGAALEGIASDLQLAPAGEAWVPGGIRALAAVAHTKGTPSYQTFFADYARAIANEISPGGTALGIPQYLETLRTYLATVTELIAIGERREEGTRITLHVGDKVSERALVLFGWRQVQRGEAVSIEPSDAPEDEVRQQLLPLLGVDEIALQKTLRTGGTFTIDIPSENARLIGGDAWSEMLSKDAPTFRGGLAEAFATDLRLARAYAGLGAMGPDAAAALVSGLGLRTVVTRYADLLARYGESFAVSKTGVVLPGGPEAEPAWKQLIGVPARDPSAFFRTLLDKDQGKLAAFYFAVWRGDAAHQRFFTRTPARAERFYAWYRDSPDLRDRVSLFAPSWRKSVFQELPLDASGNIKFPGGRSAWMNPSGTDEDVLTNLKALEALVPVTQVEARRRTPLDERSAALLAQHYAEWQGVFPYFQRLPGLDRPEFEALNGFATAVSRLPADLQKLAVGNWYSLVDLVTRGFEAGSLDATQSAAAFRHVNTVLASPNSSSAAVAALREIAGGGDLADAVAGKLLRLGERRAAFDRVLELQNVDLRGLDPIDHAKTLAALSGLVYAAALEPSLLLVNQDHGLVRKHQFVPSASGGRDAFLFAGTKFVRSSNGSGSYLTGGFANLEEIKRAMAGTEDRRPVLSVPALKESAPAEPPDAPIQADFKANGRLVEVYATVTDSSGRYIDDLKAAQFAVMDEGQPAKIMAFESRFAHVSVALLLDTTGSMQLALPALKNASLKLIDDLRPGDSVAVYSFSDSVNELQTFTSDKDAAKRAVLHTQPFGSTALYDAMTRVSRDLTGREGKKVIVLFTDGDDNFSSLTKETAVAATESSGVPVFTIAEGEALTRPEFLAQLGAISKATGGEPFIIRNTGEIRRVFEKISEDLMHGYLLSFQPAAGETNDQRTIRVVLPASKGYKVRAREGYRLE